MVVEGGEKDLKKAIVDYLKIRTILFFWFIILHPKPRFLLICGLQKLLSLLREGRSHAQAEFSRRDVKTKMCSAAGQSSL